MGRMGNKKNKIIRLEAFTGNIKQRVILPVKLSTTVALAKHHIIIQIIQCIA